jgi:hypothetical protein
VANKGANANAMFLLKCRHGYREMDSPHTKVDVNVAAPTNVLVVQHHGSDEEWQAKALAQQKTLTLDAAHIAPSPALPVEASHTENAFPAQDYGPPSWKPRA